MSGDAVKCKLYKLFKVSVIVTLVLTCLILGVSAYNIRHSWPQVTGTIRLPWLKDKVEVIRDPWGVPHIYASNQHDLFTAQGYIHAQDRFWQMVFWRHTGSGRLAEMFGKLQVNTDKFLRTLGWARVAQQELSQSDPNTISILQAYANGVNAYLSDHHGSALSLEYAVLKLLNPSYKPEAWQPLHSLTWGKAIAWQLGNNLDTEIERTILLKTLTRTQVEELFPPYPVDHPFIVSNAKATPVKSSLDLPYNRALVSAISPALKSISEQLTSIHPLLNSTGSGIGSNNWVISGKHTVTGKPILANDPHLDVQMPSIWYEIGLHCISKGPECPDNVTGFSFAGTPGILIGHNDRIAWGVTNLGPDVQDLYVEKINPNNSNQYEFNGKWVNMQLVKENIQVAGSKSIPQTLRYTNMDQLSLILTKVLVNSASKIRLICLNIMPLPYVGPRWNLPIFFDLSWR